LYEKYKSKGFVVLGFPCNQFGRQEPGDEASIKKFATSKYGVTFPMFSKVDVNGANTHPVYEYLKSDPGVGTDDISWNFAKFLVNKQGKVVARDQRKKPYDFEKQILDLLDE